MKTRALVAGVLAAILLTALAFRLAVRAGGVQAENAGGSENGAASDEASYDWQLPDPRWQQQAFRHERPIHSSIAQKCRRNGTGCPPSGMR